MTLGVAMIVAFHRPSASSKAAYRQLLHETSLIRGRSYSIDPSSCPSCRPSAWREDLNPRIDVVRELAMEFSAIYIPLDGVFAAASTKAKPEFWAEDGVHPTLAGHGLIARVWLAAMTC